MRPFDLLSFKTYSVLEITTLPFHKSGSPNLEFIEKWFDWDTLIVNANDTIHTTISEYSVFFGDNFGIGIYKDLNLVFTNHNSSYNNYFAATNCRNTMVKLSTEREFKSTFRKYVMNNFIFSKNADTVKFEYNDGSCYSEYTYNDSIVKEYQTGCFYISGEYQNDKLISSYMAYAQEGTRIMLELKVHGKIHELIVEYEDLLCDEHTVTYKLPNLPEPCVSYLWNDEYMFEASILMDNDSSTYFNKLKNIVIRTLKDSCELDVYVPYSRKLLQLFENEENSKNI